MSALFRNMRRVQFDDSPRLYSPDNVMTNIQNHQFPHRHESAPLHAATGLLDDFELRAQNAGIGRAQSDLAPSSDRQEYKKYKTTWSLHHVRGDDSVVVKCDKCKLVLFKLGPNYLDIAINNTTTPRPQSELRNEPANNTPANPHRRDHLDSRPHSSLNQMERVGSSSSDFEPNAKHNGLYPGNGDVSERPLRHEIWKVRPPEENLRQTGRAATEDKEVVATHPQTCEENGQDSQLPAIGRTHEPGESYELTERIRQVSDSPPISSFMQKLVHGVKGFKFNFRDLHRRRRRQAQISNQTGGRATKNKLSREGSSSAPISGQGDVAPTQDGSDEQVKTPENNSAWLRNPSRSTNTSTHVQRPESSRETESAQSHAARTHLDSKGGDVESSTPDQGREGNPMDSNSRSPYGQYVCTCQCCSHNTYNHIPPSAGSMSLNPSQQSGGESPDSGHSVINPGTPSLPDLLCLGGTFRSSRSHDDSRSSSRATLHGRDHTNPVPRSLLGQTERTIPPPPSEDSETTEYYNGQYYGNGRDDSPSNSSEIER